MYNIPLFDLNFDSKEIEAVDDVLKSRWISMGPKCAEFERRFETLLEVKHAITVSNCTAAIHLALKALDIGEGDEVLCPSLTFVATVNSVKYVGAKPVFCDIEGREDLTISLSDIKNKITSKTKAIIVMHYAGYSCAMDEIMEVAKQNGLFVVEDACHGPLSEYKGQKLGTIGDVGCFSFFSNKNISTGEGGMIVTSNDDLYERIKLMRSHGMTTLSYERSKGHSTSYDVVCLGYNYRMDDIHAAIGLTQLDKICFDLNKRKNIRCWYAERLKDNERICIPFIDRIDFSSNYIFPIVLAKELEDKRDTVREKLADMGIQTSVHYPPVHLFSIYRDKTIHLQNTEEVAASEITLPMYGRLSLEEVDYITDRLKQIVSKL